MSDSFYPVDPSDPRIDDPHQSWSSRNRYTNEDEYLHENHPVVDHAEEAFGLHERGD